VGNIRLDFMIAKIAIGLAITVFPFALLVYAFSGCDLRQRGAKHACRDGHAEQCLAVGKFYEERTDGLIATLLSNATTAKQYYGRACDLKSVDGCARLGHMVVVGSYNAIKDDGFTHENGMAALAKACDAGVIDACREFADASEPAQAVVALGKLCDGGDHGSCEKLVPAYLAAGDGKHAVELLTTLCDAGEDEHCRELGGAFLTGSKWVDPDPPRGMGLLTKACDHGSQGACRDLADANRDGSAADPARAGELYAKACDKGDVDACFSQAKLVLASDPAKAVQLFTAECEHDVRGCDALGDIYRVGADGIDRDRDRAYKYYEQTCRAGFEISCWKHSCMNRDDDACYKVHKLMREPGYHLEGAFIMK
jgi:TPR repeat protein